jgi:hypothetical protein
VRNIENIKWLIPNGAVSLMDDDELIIIDVERKKRGKLDF